jgi:CubicO group peptidase (beta-lactamase class C family)
MNTNWLFFRNLQGRKNIPIYFFTLKSTICFFVLFVISIYAVAQPTVLGGFQKSIYYDEQVKVFSSPVWAPEVKFHINAPSATTFDPQKKVMLIFFALPNGNTIENTIGNKELTGVDWHYDIQHIGAQTRFLRSKIKDANVVVCYLESNQKAWNRWRSKYPDSTIKTIVDSVRSIFKAFDTRVTLNSHSGGGYFIFGYLNSVTKIPSYVERISFLDSNYGYDETFNYGKKLSKWLKSSKANKLCVLAYNDSVALYNGLPVVSATGGTWYRSKRMIEFLKKDFAFTFNKDADFWRYTALNKRIEFILKTNPEKAILHTVQVERNGFIQSILSGTPLEEKDYKYYPLTEPTRAYASLVQPNLTYAGTQFPPRPANAINGSVFMEKIKNMKYLQREPFILQEIKSGNTPDFCKSFVDVNFHYKGHLCKVQVMPDYLAIGSNEDFCRIPVSPQTAQAIADYLGCSLPTTRIVDSVAKAATYRITPITHTPVGNGNELVGMFILHNQEIERALAVVGTGWDRTTNIVDGLKKDIVISNRLAASTGKVAIYGWYKPDGTFIQPLYLGHVHWYMDYSHGVRLVNSLIMLDGKPATIQQVLKDSVLYPMLSSETGVMDQPYYTGIPETPLAPTSISLGINSKSIATIDSIVKDGIEAKAFPGCQILVLKDGKPFLEKCFGYYTYDKVQKVTPNMMYDLASLSKTTGALLAIMKLYDNGKFKLTDKASNFLPFLRGTDKENITITELLFHESGLTPSIPFYREVIDENSYKAPFFASKKDSTHTLQVGENMYACTSFNYKDGWVSKIPTDEFTVHVADNFYISKRFHTEAMQLIAQSKLNSKVYRYSDVNFILLKEIAETISGTSLDVYLNMEFYTPMKLKHLSYLPLRSHKKEEIAPSVKNDFLRGRVLQGFVHDESAAFMGGVSGNAGLFGSSGDVAKVYQMMLNGGEMDGKRYISKETCKLFTTTTSASGRRGLGYDKPVPSNPKISSCCISAPYAVYGHTGFTGTCCWVDPVNKLVYVFLSNRTYPDVWNNKLSKMDIRTNIQEVIYQSIK